MVVGDLLTSFHLIQKLLMDRWRHFGWAVIWLATISKGLLENDCWRHVHKFTFDSKMVDGQMVPLQLGSYLA